MWLTKFYTSIECVGHSESFTMRKAIYDKSGNHQILDVPLKAFAKQTSGLGTGNVWGSTQFSSFIRPYTQTECNGYTREPGHLQDFDLNSFKSYLPRWVIERVKDLAKEKSVILYMFFHHTPDRSRKIIDGVVVSDDNYNHISTFYLNPSWKAQQTVEIAREYVCNI